MLDVDKAIETIVYISHESQDLIHIMKILYYADKYHLEKYGRFITGDTYIPMPNGPVPSGAYDIVKYARGDGIFIINAPVEEAISVTGKIVEPLRPPDVRHLSESDIECLNKAIEENASLSVSELIDKASKEKPYQIAKKNFETEISFESIALDLSNGKEILEYLRS